MNNLVAIYCRLSKEDIDKESFRESINNQSPMLLDYAYKHYFQICKIYTYEDYSGADISNIRPQYNQLLHDAENREFNIILCLNPDLKEI